MLTDKDLRELSEFSAPQPVLSLYLNTDPSEGNADAYRLRLRNLLKNIDLPDDLLAVERYFNLEYDWTGRGVAIFSCAPQGFFRAYPLALPVRNMVYKGNRPSVRILRDLMDSYGHYGVALVDKQGARLFIFHMGELFEQDGFLGDEVRRTKHGGASAMPGARSGAAGRVGKKVEEVVERNMKHTAAYAVDFFSNHHARRLLIGGTEENVNAFRQMLPKAWQSLVLATFPMSVTASHGELIEKVLEIGDMADGRREKNLVRDLLTTASSSGSRAVVGLEPTLQAVNDSRVETVVLTDGFRHPAYQCAQCARLTVLPSQVCKYCGGKYHELPEVRDVLITEVIRAGGDVEVVAADPAFDDSGNIGAYLRY